MAWQVVHLREDEGILFQPQGSAVLILVNLHDDRSISLSAKLAKGDQSRQTCSLPPLHFSVLRSDGLPVEAVGRGGLLTIDLETLAAWPSHFDEGVNVYQVPPSAASLVESFADDGGDVPHSQLVRALTEILSPVLFEGAEKSEFAAFRSYISQHLAEGISTDGIAAALGMSAFQLRELTKDTVGMTPAAWLREERVQLARDLLATTTVSIELIAEQTGYSDRFSFSRAFTAVTGESPSAYREAAMS